MIEVDGYRVTFPGRSRTAGLQRHRHPDWLVARSPLTNRPLQTVATERYPLTRVTTNPPTSNHAGKKTANLAESTEDSTTMAPKTYEITFTGQAVPAIIAAFEDFDVIIGEDTTTLRGKLADQTALRGAIDRLQNLGLELLALRMVEHPSNAPTQL